MLQLLYMPRCPHGIFLKPQLLSSKGESIISVRLILLQSPGDIEGLTAIHPGGKVWLLNTLSPSILSGRLPAHQEEIRRAVGSEKRSENLYELLKLQLKIGWGWRYNLTLITPIQGTSNFDLIPKLRQFLVIQIQNGG